jgi:hypothetical protein
VTRQARAATLIMLTTIAITGTRGTAAADWSNSLEASVNAGYVVNPQMLAGSSVSDETAVLSLDGNTSMATERAQLSVVPRFSVTRYQTETELNIDAGGLDVTAQEKFERGLWTFAAQGITDSTVTSELGTTGITEANRRHTAGTLSTSFQYSQTERLSWQVGGSWQRTHYSDAETLGLSDYDYGSVQFGPSWNFTERMLGSLNFEADRITPDGGARQKDYSVSAALKRNFTERYAWHLTVGGTRVESDGASSASSLLLDLGASQQGERVQWDLSVKRAVTPVGLGLLAQEDQAVFNIAAGLSERSSLAAAVSVIRTRPVIYLNYLVYDGASWGQVSIDWQYHLTTHWMLSLGFLQARARTADADWANGAQAHVGILWQSGRL